MIKTILQDQVTDKNYISNKTKIDKTESEKFEKRIYLATSPQKRDPNSIHQSKPKKLSPGQRLLRKMHKEYLKEQKKQKDQEMFKSQRASIDRLSKNTPTKRKKYHLSKLEQTKTIDIEGSTYNLQNKKLNKN